jgi:hypothetical protein
MSNSSLHARFKAASVHLIASICVAAIAAGLVFWLWYPGPFRQTSGGESLFFILMGVDVVVGPVLTFAVFNLAKGWAHLKRDLGVIVILQLGALIYGMHTVYITRPVIVAFETDRFRAVAHADIRQQELEKAPKGLSNLSWNGPIFVGTRAAQDGKEKLEAIELALRGWDVGTRPSFWQPIELSKGDILKRARPVAALRTKYPARAVTLDDAIAKTGLPANQIKFLPLMAHRSDWSVLLNGTTAEVVGYVSLDGFF